MTVPPTPRQAPPRDPRAASLLCCAVIAAAVVAAYGGSLSGAFLYDDVDSITLNPTIRHLATAFRPPQGATVSGRPLLNLSFAANYAISGLNVWSYHALNLAIHVAAALVLFGIVRRTLAAARGPAAADPGFTVALSAALLWALHPLQTESVAYVVQRAESLMGLLYLLTLYCFIRHADGGRGAPLWATASCVACLLGMATKEVMVTAPVLVLLYDRAFVSGSFREAWRRHGGVLGSLFACWLPLALLAFHAGDRSGTAGFGSGVAWWAYAVTQFRAVGIYLRLSFWPHPLVGDYGRILGGSFLEVAFGVAVVLVLVAGTLVLLRRNSAAGFLGAGFLLVLAPSSSVVPVSTEIIAEHRMYLPLAAVVVGAVLALHAALGGRRLFLAVVALLALVLASLTLLRTRVYRDPAAFWGDDVLRVPGNAGAWNNLGVILAAAGDEDGAIADYRRALDLAPGFAFAHDNLGNSLAATGHPAEAEKHYGEALLSRPSDPSIHRGLAYALSLEKRPLAAAAEYREAIRLEPLGAEGWAGLGASMVQAGNLPEAAEAYSRAVALRTDRARDRVDYGDVLVQLGRRPEAMTQYCEALRLDPSEADVHNNLGSLLAGAGRLPEAQAEFEKALQLRPGYGEARENLGRVRLLEQAGAHP